MKPALHIFLEVLECNESAGEEMPLNEDGTTIMSPEDDPETKTRRDAHRQSLERQQSLDYERYTYAHALTDIQTQKHMHA